VVDDGSTDATSEVLDREKARGELQLKVIRRAASSGPAAARQEGWRAASAPLIAFTDDDCVPTPGWLAVGIGAWNKEPDSIIQGRTEPDPSERDELGPFSRTIELTSYYPAFNTCNIFYSRAILERIGGFDIDAFDRAPGGEDCDLGWRAIKAGGEPRFVDDALVYHAVDRVGALGMLRVAARWTTPMKAFARHPELREAIFVRRYFWKLEHYWLTCALIALVLPRSLWWLRIPLSYRYVRNLWARGRVIGGGPGLAPYYFALDLVETVAVARGGIRYRTPML